MYYMYKICFISFVDFEDAGADLKEPTVAESSPCLRRGALESGRQRLGLENIA